MRKSIDTYIEAIAHDNELYIRESYMTVADTSSTTQRTAPAITSSLTTTNSTRLANRQRLRLTN